MLPLNVYSHSFFYLHSSSYITYIRVGLQTNYSKGLGLIEHFQVNLVRVTIYYVLQNTKS